MFHVKHFGSQSVSRETSVIVENSKSIQVDEEINFFFLLTKKIQDDPEKICSLEKNLIKDHKNKGLSRYFYIRQ